MRDRRFVAEHRGGQLNEQDHATLALWAADSAERVLYFFANETDDDRPAKAISVARAWANGDLKTGVAMKAAVAAHAAARQATSKAAIAAARAAGHAVATAHAADHSMGALLYALKAMEAAGVVSDRELRLQLQKLPDHLVDQVEEGMAWRIGKLGIKASLEK